MLRIEIAAASPARRRALWQMIELGTRHFNVLERVTVKPAELLREAQETAGQWLAGRDTPEAAQNALAEDPTPSVLVIDHAGTGPSGHRLSTSSEATGTIRATGHCRIIVAVDTVSRSFDAGHLFGDHRSPADLSVRLADLAHPALWRREPGETGFPAYWPELAGWAMRRRTQMDQLMRSPKATLAQILLWAPRRFGELSRRQAGALDPAHTNLRAVRWTGAWTRSGRDLTAPIRERIVSIALGGRPVPQWHARHALAALGAAWLDRWVRLELLPVSRPLLTASRVASIWPQAVHNDAASVAEWIEQAQTATAATSDPSRDAEAGSHAFDPAVWHMKDAPMASAELEHGSRHWYPVRVFDTAAVRVKSRWWPMWKLDRNPLFCEASSAFFDPREESGYNLHLAQEDAWPRSLRKCGRGCEPRCRIERHD